MQENKDFPNFSTEEVIRLITLTEELQTENEQFQNQIQQQSSEKQELLVQVQTLSLQVQKLTQKLSEMQQSAQMLLSQNQMLESKVAQQSERIEMLSESDKQLSLANEKLKQLESEKKNLKLKEATVASAANKRQRELDAYKRELDSRESDIKSKSQKADELLAQRREAYNKAASVRNSFEKFVVSLLGTISLGANILITLFMGIVSKRVREDTVAIGHFFKSAFSCFFEKMYDEYEWNFAHLVFIKDETNRRLTSAFLYLLLLVAIIFIIVVGMIFLIKCLVDFYSDKDDHMGTVIAIFTALAVIFFAEHIQINIYLVFSLVMLLYIFGRIGVEKYRESR